jgi:5-methylcytosine-specific restriction endonuclease McrA
VHHIDGIPWDKIIKPIYKYLLVKPKKLQVLCEKCHAIKTKEVNLYRKVGLKVVTPQKRIINWNQKLLIGCHYLKRSDNK